MSNPKLREIDVFQTEPEVFRVGEIEEVGLIVSQKDNDGNVIDHTLTITEALVSVWDNLDPSNPIVTDADILSAVDLTFQYRGYTRVLLPYNFNAETTFPVGRYTVQFTFERDNLKKRIGEIFVNVVESVSPL